MTGEKIDRSAWGRHLPWLFVVFALRLQIPQQPLECGWKLYRPIDFTIKLVRCALLAFSTHIRGDCKVFDALRHRRLELKAFRDGCHLEYRNRLAIHPAKIPMSDNYR